MKPPGTPATALNPHIHYTERQLHSPSHAYAVPPPAYNPPDFNIRPPNNFNVPVPGYPSSFITQPPPVEIRTPSKQYFTELPPPVLPIPQYLETFNHHTTIGRSSSVDRTGSGNRNTIRHPRAERNSQQQSKQDRKSPSYFLEGARSINNHNCRTTHRQQEPSRSSRSYSQSRNRTLCLVRAKRARSEHTYTQTTHQNRQAECQKNMNKDNGAENSNIEDLDMVCYNASAQEYYTSSTTDAAVMSGSVLLGHVCKDFDRNMILRGRVVREELPPRCPEDQEYFEPKDSGEEPSSESVNEDRLRAERQSSMREFQRKTEHPRRLHPHIWYNEVGESNGGPGCLCGRTARCEGIHHNIFPGEPKHPRCRPERNNVDQLYHYRISITPDTDLVHPSPTTITYNGRDYVFVGFSLFSHYKLGTVPPAVATRSKLEYTLVCVEEQAPLNFIIMELELFESYLFKELLELLDLSDEPSDGSCPQFHLMPRFITKVPERDAEKGMEC